MPEPVVKFLNNPDYRSQVRGVVAGGNTNFGDHYGLAGDIIAAKLGIPMMYRFELSGTDYDVQQVREGLNKFWTTTHSTPN